MRPPCIKTYAFLTIKNWEECFYHAMAIGTKNASRASGLRDGARILCAWDSPRRTIGRSAAEAGRDAGHHGRLQFRPRPSDLRARRSLSAAPGKSRKGDSRIYGADILGHRHDR